MAVPGIHLQELHDQGRIHYPARADGSPDFEKRPRLKRYLNEQKGAVIANVWSDIQPISAHAKERVGYPTQKPLALLERIIKASTNDGDTILDPFCGCATACVAADRLGRKWMGIDISPKAVELVNERLMAPTPLGIGPMFHNRYVTVRTDIPKPDGHSCSITLPEEQARPVWATGGPVRWLPDGLPVQDI